MSIKLLLICTLFCFENLKSQSTISNLDKGIAIGNILIQGYMAIRGSGGAKNDRNSKTIESFCIKNKLEDRIIFKLLGTIDEGEVKKELVIRKQEKECVFDLPKGIYTYEVSLPSNEVFQKGEYRVEEKTLMTVGN